MHSFTSFERLPLRNYTVASFNGNFNHVSCIMRTLKGSDSPPTFPLSTCNAQSSLKGSLHAWLMQTKAAAKLNYFVGLQLKLVMFYKNVNLQ